MDHCVSAFLWTFVRSDHVVLPVLLHTLGGVFWAGIHLCTNKLVLRITPREERAICISLHNIIAGVGATTAPIAAGLAIKILGSADLHLLHPAITPLRLMFLVSEQKGSIQEAEFASWDFGKQNPTFNQQ